MSFREKILWTTLIAGIAPYLWYFGSVALALCYGDGSSVAFDFGAGDGYHHWPCRDDYRGCGSRHN